MLTVVRKTETFTVSANQSALLVSRNAEKNLKNNSGNNSVRNLTRGISPKFCFVFIIPFD